MIKPEASPPVEHYFCGTVARYYSSSSSSSSASSLAQLRLPSGSHRVCHRGQVEGHAWWIVFSRLSTRFKACDWWRTESTSDLLPWQGRDAAVTWAVTCTGLSPWAQNNNNPPWFMFSYSGIRQPKRPASGTLWFIAAVALETHPIWMHFIHLAKSCELDVWGDYFYSLTITFSINQLMFG